MCETIGLKCIETMNNAYVDAIILLQNETIYLVDVVTPLRTIWYKILG